MDTSFRGQCLQSAYDFYSNNITSGAEKLEQIIQSCSSNPDSLPMLEELLGAIQSGDYSHAADILFYRISLFREREITDPLSTFISLHKNTKIKFLIYEWAACMQSDLEEILSRNHIPFDRFSYVFYGSFFEDPYFIRSILKQLQKEQYTAILSMNYWPLLAEVCHQANIPYISWIYDCPIPISWDSTIQYPTNHAFVFDQTQFWDAAKQNYDTIDFIPLAVNSSRLEQIKLSADDHRNYDADVSFVGRLYNTDLSLFRMALSPEETNYLDAAIERQTNTYGMYFIDDLIANPLSETIYQRYEDAGNPPPKTRDDFRSWFSESLAHEVTRRERCSILRSASEICTTRYYGPDTVPDAPRLLHCGSIDNGLGMFKVFKASKINLNITYRWIKTGIPLRILEILGAGGFLLTNYQKELEYYFRLGEDLVIYDSIEDANSKIQYYLSHEDERLKIAENGHNAVKKLSFENQLGTILLRSLP